MIRSKKVIVILVGISVVLALLVMLLENHYSQNPVRLAIDSAARKTDSVDESSKTNRLRTISSTSEKSSQSIVSHTETDLIDWDYYYNREEELQPVDLEVLCWSNIFENEPDKAMLFEFKDIQKFRKFMRYPGFPKGLKIDSAISSFHGILSADLNDAGFSNNFEKIVEIMEEGHLPFEETRRLLFIFEQLIPGSFPEYRQDFRDFLIEEYLYSQEEFKEQERNWGDHYDAVFVDMELKDKLEHGEVEVYRWSEGAEPREILTECRTF